MRLLSKRKKEEKRSREKRREEKRRDKGEGEGGGGGARGEGEGARGGGRRGGSQKESDTLINSSLSLCTMITGTPISPSSSFVKFGCVACMSVTASTN